MMSLRFFVFGGVTRSQLNRLQRHTFRAGSAPRRNVCDRHNFGGGAGHFAGALVPDNDTVLYQLKTKVDPAQQQR
jgi:hypothetical protein